MVGLRGGGQDCDCGPVRLEESTLTNDARLTARVSQAQIRDKVAHVNSTISTGTKFPRPLFWSLACCSAFGFVLFVTLMAILSRPALISCKGGLCAPGQDPLVDSCCVFWCCPGPEATSEAYEVLPRDDLRSVGSPLLPAWDVYADADVMGEDVCFAYKQSDNDEKAEDDEATPGCSFCGEEDERRRLAEEGTKACGTRVDGRASFLEAVGWPAVFVILWLGPFISGLVYVTVLNCKLGSIISEGFADWQQQGIITGVYFKQGSKHSRQALYLYVPPAPQPVQMMPPGGVQMMPVQGQYVQQPGQIVQPSYVQQPVVMQGQVMQPQVAYAQPAQGQVTYAQPQVVQGQVMPQPEQGYAQGQVVTQGQYSAVPSEKAAYC